MLPDLLSTVVPLYAALCQVDVRLGDSLLKRVGLDSLSFCRAEALLLCLTKWPLVQTLCLLFTSCLVSPLLANGWTKVCPCGFFRYMCASQM